MRLPHSTDRRAALVAALVTIIITLAAATAAYDFVSFLLHEPPWAKAIRWRKAIAALHDAGVAVATPRMTHTNMALLDAPLGILAVLFPVAVATLTWRASIRAFRPLLRDIDTLRRRPQRPSLRQRWHSWRTTTSAQLHYRKAYLQHLAWVGVAYLGIIAGMALTLSIVALTVGFSWRAAVHLWFLTTCLLALAAVLVFPQPFGRWLGTYPTNYEIDRWLSGITYDRPAPTRLPYWLRWFFLHLRPAVWQDRSRLTNIANAFARAPLIKRYLEVVQNVERDQTRNQEHLPYRFQGMDYVDNTLGIFARYAYGSDVRRKFIVQSYRVSLFNMHPAQRGSSQHVDIGNLPPEGRLLYLPVALGADNAKGIFDRLDFELSDHAAGRYVYRAERKRIDVKHWTAELPAIQTYLGGRWTIEPRDGATLELLRLPDIPEAFPLTPAMLTAGQFYLGQNLNTGTPVHVDFDHLAHTLVTGPTGMGKSVLLHQLMASVITNLALFEHVHLVDLKYGLELQDYPRLSRKLTLTSSPHQLPDLIYGLLAEMDRRGQLMRDNRWTDWRGPLILIIIDEFADVLLSEPDTKKRKQLQDALIRLTNLSRALGFRFWVQSQSFFNDAIPSDIRRNLQSLISFRLPTPQVAAMFFGGDTDNLPANIVKLGRGQFIFRDGRTQDTFAIQSALVRFPDVASLARGTGQPYGNSS